MNTQSDHRRWRFSLQGFILILLIGGCTPQVQERIGSSSQPLTTAEGIGIWTVHNSVVPVCWETPGYDREKAIVKNAVARTWEWWANIDFAGWHACPTGGIGGSDTVRNVRIHLAPQDTSNAGAGGSARIGTDALSSAREQNPGVRLSFNPDGTADVGRIEYIAVHEFGHVLGFRHEQDAPGNEGPARCDDTVDSSGNPIPLTNYDRNSVMNYCNRDGNMSGNLTDTDIAGVQSTYGVRRRNIATINSCASAPLRTMASLAAPWNNNGRATFAIFPSDGSRFLYRSQWAVRDGGWSDTIRWTSGDFNGDGKTDIGAIWNNNGTNVLTVRLSTGTNFSTHHWLENAGGWMDETVWLAGDFNGDGKSDLAGVWNDGGRVSIAVYLSDGTSFPGWSQWAVRDGGWSGEIKWVTGDFNGDGRTDIGAAWDNNGSTTLTVRLSQGNRFIPAHWSQDAGHWWNTSIFVSGDFDGDGRDDIAQIWNDIGQTSIRVSRSTGISFSLPREWSRRDGGWGGDIRWIPGDFNGDGRTDIAAAWNNQGTNTLTVRLSDGMRFNPVHWTTNAGGWMESTAWCSGAFR